MERWIVVDHIGVSYTGLFSMKQLYRLIDFWTMEKGYTKHELRSDEDMRDDGKRIYILTDPYRKISDYLKYIVRIEVEASQLRDVEVEKDGKIVKMNQGNCSVFLTGYMISDYKKKWVKNSFYYFLRGMFDNYIWKSHVKRGESGLVDECQQLLSQVRAYFNLYKYNNQI